MRPKVLIAVSHLGERTRPYVERLEAKGFEVFCNGLGRPYTEDELVNALRGMFGVVAGGEHYTERVLREAGALKVIARFGVGYEKVDVPAATRHRIPVAMTFGANHEAVADCAFSLMAALLHNLVRKNLSVKAGRWEFSLHHALWRATVGIVGLGRIGKAMSRRCRGFEMTVLAYDPKPDIDFARDNGIQLLPLESLLRGADVVSLHAPYIPETENLINRSSLALMKPTAFLVNTARGGLVDEEALYEALKSGRLAGAGLDVFRCEPPTGSPLLELDNLIATPHCADAEPTTEAAMMHRCIDSILAVAEGRNPGAEYLVDPEVFS